MSGQTTSDLFKYCDFRLYLNDHYHNKKENFKHWSYGAWAKRMSIQSSSTLIMVLKGSRNPGDKLVDKFIRYFNFGKKEAEYFRDLVRLHKVNGNMSLSVSLMESLCKRHKGSEFTLIDQKTFSTISNWYFYAIRQLIKTKGFKEDPRWIAKKLRFKVNPKDIQKAIETMLDLGLLTRKKDGKLQVQNQRLNTADDVTDEGLKRFHEQMLKNSIEALRKVDTEQRQISGVTFTVNKKNISKAKSLIQKFEDDFCALIEESNGEADDVYHLEISFIPLTQSEGIK